jgi:hypothetical protein
MFAPEKENVNKFVSEEILPQTLSVLNSFCTYRSRLVIGNHQEFDFSKEFSLISRKHHNL